MYVYRVMCISQYESLDDFLCRDEAGFVSCLDKFTLNEEYLDTWTKCFRDCVEWFAVNPAAESTSKSVRTGNNKYYVEVTKEKVW